jgi:hypothetical protein
MNNETILAVVRMFERKGVSHLIEEHVNWRDHHLAIISVLQFILNGPGRLRRKANEMVVRYYDLKAISWSHQYLYQPLRTRRK